MVTVCLFSHYFANIPEAYSQPSEETMVTPRATVSSSSRRKGKSAEIRSSQTGVSSVTDAESAPEERVSRQITVGAPI